MPLYAFSRTRPSTKSQHTQCQEGLTRQQNTSIAFGESSRKNRRGAAVVEFAVVAPIFVLLVFGMIEFGRAVMVQQVLVNASREGARQAVLDGTLISEIEGRIDTYLDASGIDGETIIYQVNGITVADPTMAAAFGDAVTVSISVPFDNVSWMPVPQYIGGTILTASSVMRRETSQ